MSSWPQDKVRPKPSAFHRQRYTDQLIAVGYALCFKRFLKERVKEPIAANLLSLVVI
jgi:hypothetical protein